MKRTCFMLLLIMSSGTAVHARAPAAVAAAEAALQASMRDPASVQFRDVHAEATCDGVTYVVGYDNAKNGFGGYDGFALFLASVQAGQGQLMQAEGKVLTTPVAMAAHMDCVDPGHRFHH